MARAWPGRVAAVAPGGVDVALDLAGSGSLADLVAIVGDPTRVASAADFSAPSLGVAVVAGNANAARSLAAAAELGAAGRYTPRVQATYPLERLPEAHADVQSGHTRGKVVVTV
jgi:NADPH:quinone reductase-like Zn-dependent oxidoreductase